MECSKNTIMRSAFKKEDGFIFRPSENSKSSTPISDGIAKMPSESEKEVMAKQ